MAAALHLGSMRVIAIQDGWFTPAVDYFFPEWDRTEVDDAGAGVRPDGTIFIPFGCYLVDHPDGPILVDSGGGPNENSPEYFTTGHLAAGLEALGLAAGDVTKIVHSHLHFDHWGGDLDAAGEAAFPDATIFLSRPELAWGREQETPRERFLPLVEQGRVELLDEAAEIAAGVVAEPSPGHTPGHLSVALDGGREKALVIGDVAHHPVQLERPAWGVRFDVDPAAAATTRAATFDRLAAGSEIMIGGHWPAPGWGRVVTAGAGRRFEPI